MADFKVLEVVNSKSTAVRTGKWKNPGAALYDQLLNSIHCKGKVPADKDELDKKIKSGDYKQWDFLLKEAYLVAPVKDINNSPHGVTPFSRSGCKYPHHVIKGNKLVISVPGLRSAFITARNQGVFMNHTQENKKIVAHLNRHCRELGLRPVWHHGDFYLMEEHEVKIEQNFNDIYLYLQEKTGINLFDEDSEFMERGHRDLKYDFRKGYDFNTGHGLKLVYTLDGIKVHDIGGGYLRLHPEEDRSEVIADIQKNIKKKGNLDHLSSGQRVVAIIDRETGERLQEADVIGPFAPAVNNNELSIYKSDLERLQKYYQSKSPEFKEKYVVHVKVGDIETQPSFKASHWFNRDVTDTDIGDGFIVKSDGTIKRGQMAEGLKYGRGAKLNDLVGTFAPGSPIEYQHPSRKDIRRNPELYRSRLTDEEFERLMKNKTPEDVKADIESVQGEIADIETSGDSKKKKGLLMILRENLRKLVNWLVHIAKSAGKALGLTENVHESSLIIIESANMIQSIEQLYDINNFIEETLHSSTFVTESVIEGPSDNPVLTFDFNDEVGDTTPQALWKWMHDNIQYDHNTDNWKLRTAAQLYIDKKGICHDQSYFESLILHSWGYDNWQLYFVEFKDDSEQGGNSHTLTYYLDGGKYYWFENAWEDQAGIHGPYDSKEDIKQAVMDAYNNDNDINSHEYDGIVFGDHPNYRLGMNLWDYCSSWTLNDDRHFNKNQNNDQITEAMNWIEQFVHDDAFRESADVTTMSDLVKKCKTPADLLKWMRCIQYAFLDKNGKEITDDDKLYDDYRYQSPQQLIRRKKGVCWDCTGLARQWFERSKYPFCEVYLEIVDDEDCPSHTVIIFKDPGESDQVSWFESSWDAKKGIHPYGDLKTCMDNIVDEFLKSHNVDRKTTKLICTSINKGIKYGCTMQEYMDFAHASQEIDLGDLFYDEVFGESVSEQLIDSFMMERSHSKLKYEYRMGVDIHTGLLTAIQFDLDPSNIVSVGNKTTYDLAKVMNDSFTRSMYGKVLDSIDELNAKGDYDGARDLKRRLDNKMDSLTEKERQDALNSVRKNIRREGHIDYVANASKVTKIFHKGGSSLQSVEIIPMLGPELMKFRDYIDSEYDISSFKRKAPESFRPGHEVYTISYTDLFSNKSVREIFLNWVNRNNIHGEKYTVGEVGGGNKYRTTKLLWDALWMYQKYTRSPSVRGYLNPHDIQDNMAGYNGYGRPKIMKESDDVGNELIEEKYKQAEVPPNHVGFTMETLPRIMYFASKNRHPTVQNERVFLTPYVGIASLFIVDTKKAIAEEFKKQTGRLPEHTSFNTSFREWEMEGPDLAQPLKKIHINHNIGALEGVTIKGTSKGYIHCIDITDIRDQLKLFTSKDPDREVYYDGGKPLKPVEIIEHKLKWEMVYSPENAKHHGQGILERADVIPNTNDLQWMNEYLCEASHGNLKVDHRLAVDVRTNHQLHIIYSLDGIILTKNRVNGYMDYTLGGTEGDTSKAEVSKLKRLGNTNHESYNQKVLAIIDMTTGEHLQSATVKGPFGYGSKFDIKVGEVDMAPSFKSTFWGTTNTTGRIADREYIGRMRGVKGRLDDLIGSNNIRTLDNIKKMLTDAPKKNAETRKATIEQLASFLSPEEVEQLSKHMPDASEEINKLKARINEIYRDAGHNNVMGRFRHQQESYNEGGEGDMPIIDMDERILVEDGTEEMPVQLKTQEDIEAEQEAAAKKEEEFVPIYGIVKSYSRSALRNDGTQKTPTELGSARFDKIINTLTRGDNYSHALVSFDDSLTRMYSYEDEGFVVDNIMEKDSWMGTKSIYICVMFVRKSDRDRSMRFVQGLIDHKDETRYASANLLKAYVGTPYKTDKRFVCSSFTGYIMSCANPKNLHRDFSRLRPEDITILPRAFYVMNVVDREDFVKHRPEIQDIVKNLYNTFKEEIDDYNNHLPKLMLKDRCDKLKTIDRIFDWIIDRL